MNKRGQITLFIIVALIVTVLVGVTLYVNYISKTPMTDEEVLLTPEQQSLNVYVKGCLEKVGEDVVYLIGKHSGYLNTLGDPNYQETGDGRVFQVHYYAPTGEALSYFYNGNELLMRTNEDIEKMISNYVTIEMHKCLDFKMYEDQGFKVIKPKSFRTEVKILSEKVFLRFNYPIKLSKESSVVELEEFVIDVDIRLGRILEKVNDFVKLIRNKKEFDVAANCKRFSFADKKMNIYVSDNFYSQEYSVTFVDAKPLDFGKLPFKFMFGIQNVELIGDCVG